MLGLIIITFLFVVIIMSSTKKISINPEFFKLSNISTKKKSKKGKKEKPPTELVKKDLKKQLINKVNEHRKNIQKEKLVKETNENVKEISNNIDQSLEYLNTLAHKKVEKKKKRRERKQKNKTFKITEEPTPSSQPPYSNLKNSSRPTYKQWRKTVKNNKNENINENPIKNKISFGEGNEIQTETRIFEDSFEERQKKLSDLKINFTNLDKDIKEKKKKVKRKHRTIRRKITLGKHKNRIGVLIKNKKTRKNISDELDVLKKKSINQVKKYLRKHNFIKIGCSAPDSLLKDMFVNVYSSGDIYNKNPDILLHNYVGNL